MSREIQSDPNRPSGLPKDMGFWLMLFVVAIVLFVAFSPRVKKNRVDHEIHIPDGDTYHIVWDHNK
jgi:hypothetical protein